MHEAQAQCLLSLVLLSSDSRSVSSLGLSAVPSALHPAIAVVQSEQSQPKANSVANCTKTYKNMLCS